MIKLQFLGTGGLGSARIKNKLSRDYRRFPSLLIDERIIIDPSEDIFEFEESFMLSGLYSGVNIALVTHTHLDNFSISAIERLASKRPLTVIAEKTAVCELSDIPGVSVLTASALSLIRVGEYSILPLPANHTTDNISEVALNYLVERSGKTVFYGIDGAFINSAAWRVLMNLHLDAVVLDCALTDNPYSKESVEHNNLEMAAMIKDIFITSSVADGQTKFALSHITQDKRRVPHEELMAKADSLGLKLTYDGYLLVI